MADGCCEVIAHRGASREHPENTLAALRAAVAAGADRCEFDVRCTGDGVAVLMHDADVARTTSGRGRVDALTYAALARLDAGSWKHARHRGETVPTLAAALAALAGSGCAPVIEIKESAAVEPVVRLLRDCGQAGAAGAAVIAFDGAVVRRCRDALPHVDCGLLLDAFPAGIAGPAARLDWLRGCAAATGTDLLDLNHRLLDAALVQGLRAAGLRVWCYTVDEPGRMRRLAGWGVVAVTTNRPDRAVQALRSPPAG